MSYLDLTDSIDSILGLSDLDLTDSIDSILGQIQGLQNKGRHIAKKGDTLPKKGRGTQNTYGQFTYTVSALTLS